MAVANLLDRLWASLQPNQDGKDRATFDRVQKRFAPCPASPNCVSTQAPATDTEHAIDPISYTGTAADAHRYLLQILQAMPRMTRVTNTPDYIHVEFRSQRMRFVDDVEFYIDAAAHLIHFRSASRMGHSDLGVNRKRMETIRQEFDKLAH